MVVGIDSVFDGVSSCVFGWDCCMVVRLLIWFRLLWLRSIWFNIGVFRVCRVGIIICLLVLKLFGMVGLVLYSSVCVWVWISIVRFCLVFIISSLIFLLVGSGCVGYSNGRYSVSVGNWLLLLCGISS